MEKILDFDKKIQTYILTLLELPTNIYVKAVKIEGRKPLSSGIFLPYLEQMHSRIVAPVKLHINSLIRNWNKIN